MLSLLKHVPPSLVGVNPSSMTPRQASKDQHRLKEKIEKEEI